MTIDWRQRLWLWGHEAGSHTTRPELFGLAAASRITPAEAAHYMGVGNLMMVRFAGLPAPPYDAQALARMSVKGREAAQVVIEMIHLLRAF